MKAGKPLSYRSVAMGMRAGIAIAALIIAGVASPSTAEIRNLGIMGKTYPIAELDALDEIRNKAAGIDWQGILQSPENLRKLRNYRPEGLPRLARATVDRTYLVDMTYRLDVDIPNSKGGILYPAGYTFNPLDYIDYPRTIVVVDAGDPDQIAWLESSGHAADPNTRLLITDGIYFDVSSRINRHVFFCHARHRETVSASDGAFGDSASG